MFHALSNDQEQSLRRIARQNIRLSGRTRIAKSMSLTFSKRWDVR